MPLVSILTDLLAVFGAALAVVGFALVHLVAKSANRRFQIETDQLRDEVWELREAAEARERAEAANAAKSRFLANVTHEVRTPLNGILGMAELLAGTPLSAEQLTYLAAIRSSGSALASLIEEILDFSKIDAGKVDLVHEAFDVVALVEGVAELLAPRAQGKGLEIASTVAADVPQRVVGDPIRLRQILLNVAGNAVKFTETGGVGLKVARGVDDILLFEIVDTGPGVPTDRRTAIFEDFEQAHGQASHGGSGLGLAISKRLAERMNGTITLDSPDEGGAVFSVTLPLPAEAPQQQEAPAADFSGSNALIVADSPFEAPFLAARLAEAGATVVHAATAEAALATLADGRRYDLVLVDCALGEAATRDLGEAARRAGARQTLVLFSPYERRALERNATCAFDGWLVKPVRTRSFFARLAPTPLLAPPTSPAAAPVWTSERRTVLLAEDNEINALLATRHLERLGADVTHAPDGLTALTMAETALEAGHPFDVMVLDIRMPGLDGIELARRIRLAESARNARPARMLALSADMADTERRSAAQAGIDDFLGKPVTFARLEQSLAVLDRDCA